MRYLAIDFETANRERSSICAFGYALFEDGKVIASGAELCRPEPNYYDEWNTKIHGITAADTDNLSGFEEHIDKFYAFSPEFIVAHNASFDVSCLRHWCDIRNSEYPALPYVCTLIISRILHPGVGHSLNLISKLYDIPLNHHEAGSDALACGLILDKVIKSTGATSLRKLTKTLEIKPGMIYPRDYSPCVSRVPLQLSKEPRFYKVSDITCDLDDDVTDVSPLNGARICFTGALTFATRTDAARQAAARGAIPQDGVNAETNYLVVGISDFIDFENGIKSNKLKKAEACIGKGQMIQIISEDEFVDLLRH